MAVAASLAQTHRETHTHTHITCVDQSSGVRKSCVCLYTVVTQPCLLPVPLRTNSSNHTNIYCFSSAYTCHYNRLDGRQAAWRVTCCGIPCAPRGTCAVCASSPRREGQINTNVLETPLSLSVEPAIHLTACFSLGYSSSSVF